VLNDFLIRPIETGEMSALPLRPEAARTRPSRSATVEELIGRIADLVLQRQALRAHEASAASLEGNRAELVNAHWDLSRALIERHCPPKADAEAAA
jgi:hypothetical protein